MVGVIGSRGSWECTLKYNHGHRKWSGWVDGGRERLSSARLNPCCCGFQIEDMEISLPNIHYFNIDMSKMGLINKEEVRDFQNIESTVLPHLPPVSLSTRDSINA